MNHTGCVIRSVFDSNNSNQGAALSTAITYSRYGSPEVLTLTAADVPQPGPGQVRIRVRAVSVNLIDLKIRSGKMDGIFPVQFPVLPGWDVAGVMEARRNHGKVILLP
jgi:NADPH:quinone reductase-like Zn-dependent oxidoreductase